MSSALENMEPSTCRASATASSFHSSVTATQLRHAIVLVGDHQISATQATTRHARAWKGRREEVQPGAYRPVWIGRTLHRPHGVHRAEVVIAQEHASLHANATLGHDFA